MHAPTESSELRVICLCAEWCTTCAGFQATFAELQSSTVDAVFIWVDIEESSDLLGDFDVETFPTLLVGLGSELHFCGATLPNRETVAQLLRAARTGALKSPGKLVSGSDSDTKRLYTEIVRSQPVFNPPHF